MLSCIALIISVVATGQEKKCESFKEGYFMIDTPSVGTAVIHRTVTKQVEFLYKTYLMLEFTITWIDDCTYVLQKPKVLSNPLQNPVGGLQGIELTVSITETQSKSYFQESKTNFSNLVYKGEVFEISQADFDRVIKAGTAPIEEGEN